MNVTTKSYNRWQDFVAFWTLGFILWLGFYAPAVTKWSHKDENLVTTLLLGGSTKSPLADVIQLGIEVAILVFINAAALIISAKLILRKKQ